MTPAMLLKERHGTGHQDPRQHRRCLLITRGFQFTKAEMDKVMIVTFTITTVLGWRLATGDWNLAAGFGSFIVALITLLLTRK